MKTIFEMTAAEMISFFSEYDACEILKTEEEVDFVMSMVPEFFNNKRPKLINWNWSIEDEKAFEELRKENEKITSSPDWKDEF